MNKIIDTKHKVFVGMGTKDEKEQFIEEALKATERKRDSTSIEILDRDKKDLYVTIYKAMGTKRIIYIEDPKEEPIKYPSHGDVEWSKVEDIYKVFLDRGAIHVTELAEKTLKDRGYKEGDWSFGEDFFVMCIQQEAILLGEANAHDMERVVRVEW